MEKEWPQDEQRYDVVAKQLLHWRLNQGLIDCEDITVKNQQEQPQMSDHLELVIEQWIPLPGITSLQDDRAFQPMPIVLEDKPETPFSTASWTSDYHSLITSTDSVSPHSGYDSIALSTWSIADHEAPSSPRQHLWMTPSGDHFRTDSELRTIENELEAEIREMRRPVYRDYFCHCCGGKHWRKLCPTHEGRIAFTTYQGSNRSIGWFSCRCGHHWKSHNTWSQESQNCQKCGGNSFPRKMKPLPRL